LVALGVGYGGPLQIWIRVEYREHALSPVVSRWRFSVNIETLRGALWVRNY
jgi:hypothetical protein